MKKVIIIGITILIVILAYLYYLGGLPSQKSEIVGEVSSTSQQSEVPLACQNTFSYVLPDGWQRLSTTSQRVSGPILLATKTQGKIRESGLSCSVISLPPSLYGNTVTDNPYTNNPIGFVNQINPNATMQNTRMGIVGGETATITTFTATSTSATGETKGQTRSIYNMFTVLNHNNYTYMFDMVSLSTEKASAMIDFQKILDSLKFN